MLDEALTLLALAAALLPCSACCLRVISGVSADAGDSGVVSDAGISADAGCVAAGSCDVATIGTDGSCLHQPKPDGTPCAPPQDPCVTGATCQMGECPSSVAESETPGQLRWSTPLPWAIGPFTVDDLGRSTFVANASSPSFAWPNDETLFELDACGKIVWSNADHSYDSVVLDDDQLVAGTYDSYVVGLDPETGRALWTTDVAAAALSLNSAPGSPDPVAPGDRGGVEAGAPTMTKQGLILQHVFYNQQSVSLLALYRDGGGAWNIALPYQFAGSIAADRDGNIYASNDPSGDNGPQQPVVIGVSSAGSIQFQKTFPVGPLDVTLTLEVGNDLVFIPLLGLGLSFQGATVLSGIRAEDPFDEPQSLLDASGNIVTLGFGPGGVDLEQLSATGQVNWISDGGQLAGLVLSDRGTIFGIAGLQVPNGVIVDPASATSVVQLRAIDSTTGAPLWTADLPSPFSTFSVLNSLMALTPQGSLLISDGSLGDGGGGVLAYVAGQEIPSTTAPWSRARADNTNRSCAR